MRTENAGGTWITTATGLRFTPSHAGDKVTIAFEDFQHATIRLISLVVSRDDTYRTSDGGATWSRTASAPKSESTVPAIAGATVDAATQRLRDRGFTGLPAFYSSKYVANGTVPSGVIVAQDPSPGSKWPANAPIKVIVSAGGPPVPFSSLPVQAQQFANQLKSYDASEPVLVTRTPAGDAYKTDAWLFGPCSAVKDAYRTYADPAYQDGCY